MVVCLKELSNQSPDFMNKKILLKLRLKITVFELNVKDFESDLAPGTGIKSILHLRAESQKAAIIDCTADMGTMTGTMNKFRTKLSQKPENNDTTILAQTRSAQSHRPIKRHWLQSQTLPAALRMIPNLY